ncbi:SDR family NAD(P)-dependent oxidoreductase [Solirubrobacter sp. CPCC 204708]|uniref:SDR family NAD(P)-dependent oxidoreductase n=1 Tax=Solirubrobacter deserti TaxID=2282478 RepID=A0ABT4RRV6_9ACTN|nr:SDR family NAD(P)-dependent oxidoreductase [Solirubrobacter deserti]MBE2317600.1 SDR family NAD(P)-dependent oxidoreductase [Solirubrobacter deserti]MDA0141294.1 SDR family NAD(P)-dependent oxidoreductase [Solirubrobacter deserti]
MTKSLEGRIAVVTGASSGIGAATAQRFVQAGAKVAAVARRADRLEQLDGALAVTADLSDPQAAQRVADTVHEQLGRVDLVVANAGVMLGAPFEEAEEDEFERMIDLNFRGLVRTGRVFADDLLAAAAEGGRADLIHVGSVASHLLFPNWAVYGATKAAVAQLTRNLRAEYGPRGVRVKTVEPGIVTTELGADMSHPAGIAELERLREMKTLEAGDIAEAILYAAAAPAHVNLAELVVVPTAQG